MGQRSYKSSPLNLNIIALISNMFPSVVKDCNLALAWCWIKIENREFYYWKMKIWVSELKTLKIKERFFIAKSEVLTEC